MCVQVDSCVVFCKVLPKVVLFATQSFVFLKEGSREPVYFALVVGFYFVCFVWLSKRQRTKGRVAAGNRRFLGHSFRKTI